MKYSIVIPAHNEEKFIAQTLESVLGQTLLPQTVIVVNDNSNDGTEHLIDAYVAKSTLVRKCNILSSNLHLPGSKVVNAFNKGLEIVGTDYDFIVKLDADIILPANYFQEITNIFKTHPKVGIAGGFAYEQDMMGQWNRNHPMNNDHVRGAFKSYTKACFTAIGGLRNAMGWDTVDELLAKFHGFDIHTDEGLKVKHLRPTGKDYNKKAKLMQGRAMYTMRYGWSLAFLASGKMAWKHKKLQSFMDNLLGFNMAKREKVPFIVTSEEGKFIRTLRWNNIKGKLF